jgi:oxygen-independent coproporphyrinogen-3 oxidase
MRALESEILKFQEALPDHVDTVYIGGGTPSRMGAERFAGLLRAVGGRFQLAPKTEVTLECNPEALDHASLLAFRQAGVNRITLGVQSFDDDVLRRAGRRHDAARARDALRLAKGLPGIDVNADFILGLPGERLEAWSDSMAAAAALGTDHISVYMLETDKRSPLSREIARGEAVAADGEVIGSAYSDTIDILENLGLRQYEISNFARGGRLSRHNMKYWTDAWYGGFGLGAHSYMDGFRRSNISALDEYIAAVEAGRDPRVSLDPWDPGRRLQEALITGLRLAAGMDLEALGERYGVDVSALYHECWDRACDDGLLLREGERVRLTRAGMLHANELFANLIAE